MILWVLCTHKRKVRPLTEKEIRKLNRYQLLELLIVQLERADRLQARLDSLENKMNSQDLKLTAIGSIAEASLQLSGVFESAQKAADMYVDAAKKHAEEIERDAREKAEAILLQAHAKARRAKRL